VIVMNTDKGGSQSAPVGVIGGSGLYGMEGLTDISERAVRTPFGPPSDPLLLGTLAGVRVAFLARHGRGHRIMPSEVNYRANIFALKSVGVERVISISACGSLRPDFHPGDVVVPDQLFDFTRGRKQTFYGNGIVVHPDVADPFCPSLSQAIAASVEEAGGRVHRGGSFITIEGPRFSTKAESRVYRAWGMDIIGMTTSPEAFLAREAELCYGVLAHITDYDVWHETEAPVSVEGTIETLAANTVLAQAALRVLLPRLVHTQPTCECAHAMQATIVTQRDQIPDDVRHTLTTLLGDCLA
jgi:5'-methylthioadenosine phosphorylase